MTPGLEGIVVSLPLRGRPEASVLVEAARLEQRMRQLRGRITPLGFLTNTFLLKPRLEIRDRGAVRAVVQAAEARLSSARGATQRA